MTESKLNKVGYELDSINIVQTTCSDIKHRFECDPMIEMCDRQVYPVIVAPMGAVTNENNYKVWLENNFICVVPRTVDFDKRIEISKETFASFSLDEAEKLLSKSLNDGIKHYVCIDIAHGTMDRLYDVCKKLKMKFKRNLEIMTGNVANPDAYPFYANAGIDYMRASVGSGSRCTTSVNSGPHYPLASLIDELRMRKETWDSNFTPKDYQPVDFTKIIVDGGISNFDGIQKSLALGAYAVMAGQIFAKAEEACEPIVYLHPDKPNMADAISKDDYFRILKGLEDQVDVSPYRDDRKQEELASAISKLKQRKPYREYYGMSTKKAQKITGGSGTKTSEGISRPVPVEYPIAKWAENMSDYLKSCMSYTGCKTIDQFRRETELIVNLSGNQSYWK